MKTLPLNDGGVEMWFWGGRPLALVSTGLIQGHFRSQILKQTWKIPSRNHIKNEHPKRRTLMPKGYQKGDKTDAKTHPKSMPKYVSTIIMKIIKQQVFLNGKIIQIHFKNNVFKSVAGCVRERKKVSTKHQQSNPNQSLNRYKINVKTMLKKVMPNWWKHERQLIPKGIPNPKKYVKNTSPNQY